MSTGGLPVAAQKIAENVPTGAVTSPVNPKEQAADVDRKMRFYGVIEAFRKGSMPSNKQIDETLDWLVKEGSPIDESKLSSEGRALVNDVRAIIRTAHKMVLNKNADELAQNFVWHTRKADASRAGGVAAPISKAEAQEHADQGLEHLRVLGRLLFTNSEARKILKDLSYLGRDVLADGAAKAADSARPSESQLNQIDETAGDARWVAQDGTERGPNESVPTSGVGAKVDQAKDTAQKAQDAREQARSAATDAAKAGADSRDPKASVGDQLRQAGSAAADQGQQRVPDDVQRDAQGQAGDAQRKAEAHADDAKERLAIAIGNADGPHSADDVRRGNVDIPNGLSDAEKQAAKASAKDKVLSLVPDKHREKAEQHVENVKGYVKEKIPEERRDQFIYRLKKVVVEQQSHRDYQEAVEYFFNLAEQYKGHAKNASDQGAGNVKAVRSDPAVAQAELELRTLLERFANNKSMQPIFDAVNQIYVDAQNDDELRKWFKRADSYLRRVLQEPGYIMKDECDREGRALRDDGQSFFSDKYRGHRENLFNSIKDFTLAFGDDPLNKQFGEDWTKLTKDLLLDGDGNLKYKQHLWQDLRSVILPTFVNKAGYVPIPRIEYTDNQLDLVIENLVLSTTNILPNIFEVEARNYFKLSPFANISNRNRHSVWIQFSQIQADIRDVAFYVKKKSGFPVRRMLLCASDMAQKIHDEGLADVFIGGNGITGKIHLETSSSKHDVFDVKEVRVKIDELKFKIRDSRHSFLAGLVRPLANNLIKKAITQAATQGIKDGLRELNSVLSDIKRRSEAAAKSDNPEETRLTGAKDALADRKKEAEAKKAEAEHTADKRNSQFAIVLDPSEKINSWESRGSLIGKQAAVQEAAGAGKEWRSPAFDVVGKPVDPASRSSASTKPSNGSAGPITAGK